MKKRNAFPLFLCLAALFSTHAYSQKLNVQQKSGPSVELSVTSFQSLKSGGRLSEAGVSDSLTQPSAQRAPAPPLTRVAVYAVGSSNCNWEFMTTVGQTSTTCDHGGSQLRVAVQEIGYGGNAIAKMNAGLLPGSANYLTESICIVGSSYVFPCPAGYTVVGWMKYYNLDGSQNGIFEFQDTSINSPWNTMYTSISIQ